MFRQADLLDVCLPGIGILGEALGKGRSSAADRSIFENRYQSLDEIGVRGRQDDLDIGKYAWRASLDRPTPTWLTASP